MSLIELAPTRLADLNDLADLPDLVAPADRKKYVSQDLKCVIPNFPEQAEMFELAGYGFGTDISYVI
jgi:hypothetical protein